MVRPPALFEPHTRHQPGPVCPVAADLVGEVVLCVGRGQAAAQLEPHRVVVLELATRDHVRQRSVQVRVHRLHGQRQAGTRVRRRYSIPCKGMAQLLLVYVLRYSWNAVRGRKITDNEQTAYDAKINPALINIS